MKKGMAVRRLVAAGAAAFSTWLALGVVAALLNVPNFAARRVGQDCDCLIEGALYVEVGALELEATLLGMTAASTVAFTVITLQAPAWILGRRTYFAALKRASLVGVVLALVVVGGIVSERYVAGANLFVSPSNEAPNFLFRLTNGTLLALHSLRGRPILLEFMTTTCAYCQAEVAHLKEVQAHFGSQVSIVSVATTWSRDTLETVKQFDAKHGVTWLSGLDVGEGTELYEVRGVPKVFLLNERLQIVRTYQGETPAETLINALRGIVK